MNNDTLIDVYCDALSGIPAHMLDPDDAQHDKNLQGLFVPSLPEGYWHAKNKVMVVGRETRGWSTHAWGEDFNPLRAYIGRAVDTHRNFLKKQLTQTKASRGNSFCNFLRDVAARSGADGLIHANLFCFAYSKTMPTKKLADYQTIAKYSEVLLKQQIRFFHPDVIVFANGQSSVGVRRSFFPISGEDNVCTQRKNYSKREPSIHINQLWEFHLYDSIRCFRIHHPSAQGKPAKEARKFLMSLLPPR